jgi:hypothetical protein
MPKLTLSADKAVIERAKRLAERRGTSVSAMFSEYIRSISAPEPAAPGRAGRRASGPITRKARGLVHLPSNQSDRQLIESALRERYGESCVDR